VTPTQLIQALGLPPGIRLDQRVPKKLLLEQGAPTAADKRAIQDGIEELVWVVALKPGNIGVPAYKDDQREYLEIHVLSASLRPKSKAARLTELIHRAVPYPLLLVTTQDRNLALSLVHKRRSQVGNEAVVLEGKLHTSALAGNNPHEAAFLATLTLASQPRQHLYSVYQGWLECLTALAAARITGQFARAISLDQAASRDEALEEYARLQLERQNLRTKAVKEKQLNRRAELNMQVQKLDQQIACLTNKL
jgi:hypothetical protein